MIVDRRGFVAVCAGALSGCLSTAELSDVDSTGDGGHPLEGTITVQIVDESESHHDVAAIAHEALEFWEAESETYAGFPVAFEFADEPDVEIAFVDELSACGEHSSEDILGCAPIVTEESTFDPPLTVQVVAADRPRGKIRITTAHELGHVLGLTHDDEPQEVMSTDPALRIPAYEQRTDVYDAFEDGRRNSNDAVLAFNEGVEFWNDEAYADAVGPFTRSDEAYSDAEKLLEFAHATTQELREIDRIETIDFDALSGHLERATTRIDFGKTAASTMRDAALEAEDGNIDEANRLREEAVAASDAARDVAFPTNVAVASALGLASEVEGDGPLDETA